MQKIEKFRKGETLKYDIGPKLNLMVERLNREFRGDGRTIMVTEFGNVISIRSIGGSAPAPAPGSGGDTYNGYFKVIDASTEATETEPAVAKIKVVYGYDESAAKCGYATINDLVFEVDVAELTITGNAFIYLQSVAIQSGDDWVAQTPTIEQSASFPTYEENKYKRLLANVYFSDNAITKIIQQHHGPVNGDTSGEC
ncbi:MAG: hypothetical protein M0P69_13360 [Bacteroidales bacterium]|nr:hypothetical protein [Bacteroidales bacterium]